jgi:hypothetical protein
LGFLLLLDIPRPRSARDRSVAPAAGVSVFCFRLEELLLDIPRLRSARDRSVVPAAGVFFLFFLRLEDLLQQVTGLADLIFPRSGIIKGPEGFWFHPVESGKGVSDFSPFFGVLDHHHTFNRSCSAAESLLDFFLFVCFCFCFCVCGSDCIPSCLPSSLL